MGNNVQFKVKEFDFKPSKHNSMKVFSYEKNRRARDILSLGYGIFELEKMIKKERIDSAYIYRFLNSYSEQLKDILNELISYILLEDIDIQFNSSNISLNQTLFKTPKNKKSTVVLFSGGIDSYSGIFWAKEYFKNIQGVFCAHTDQAWSIHIVNEISNSILEPCDILINKLYVPPITKSGYSQLRGFLYILVAGAFLDVVNGNSLVISECGPTMYQPKFGLYDSITRTTHPVVVDLAHRVLSTLLERNIKIYLPFENMTKAEVISISNNPDHFPRTHSCVSQRSGNHDGTCYGCILRRLGAIVSGIKDVEYLKDPLVDNKANSDNLLALLMFSRDILLDYQNMPFYQIENIEAYNKIDLFRRFSLDNFAAIHILKNRKIKITKEVMNIFKDVTNEIGLEILKERIDQVRSRKFKIKKYPIYSLEKKA